MVAILVEGAGLLRAPAVVALFEVLLADSKQPSTEVASAHDRFFAEHVREAQLIIERAVARAELPEATSADAVIDLVIGPALLRSLLMGEDLGPATVAAIIDRAEAALRSSSR